MSDGAPQPRPVNRHRGEVSAIIDDTVHTLRLTLGSLAELEDALDAPDLVALIERFESGRPRAADAAEVVAAGLRGGGQPATAAEVGAMQFQDGPLGAVRLAVDLLAAAFASSDRRPR